MASLNHIGEGIGRLTGGVAKVGERVAGAIGDVMESIRALLLSRQLAFTVPMATVAIADALGCSADKGKEAAAKAASVSRHAADGAPSGKAAPAGRRTPTISEGDTRVAPVVASPEPKKERPSVPAGGKPAEGGTGATAPTTPEAPGDREIPVLPLTITALLGAFSIWLANKAKEDESVKEALGAAASGAVAISSMTFLGGLPHYPLSPVPSSIGALGLAGAYLFATTVTRKNKWDDKIALTGGVLAAALSTLIALAHNQLVQWNQSSDMLIPDVIVNSDLLGGILPHPEWFAYFFLWFLLEKYHLQEPGVLQDKNVRKFLIRLCIAVTLGWGR